MKSSREKTPTSYYGRLTLLKKLFWLYLLLLIFEGALRKWVAPALLLPQLSAPLLIIRDPVGVLIIWEAFRSKKWPHRWSAALAILTIVLIGVFVVQLVIADNSLIIGLYGLRSYLLPFPVLLIMGENLDEEDLRKMGQFVLWLLLPMTLLEIAQYATGPTSYLNKGAYEAAFQISYEGDHVRASGTFSFVSGVTGFGLLAAAFIFYSLVKKGVVARWLLWADVVALIVSIPMTGARQLVFTLAGLLACVGLGAMLGIAQFGRVMRIIVPILVVAILGSFLPIFSDAMVSLTTRFQNAAQIEGGGTEEGVLVDRVVNPLFSPFEGLDFSRDWAGKGIGRGAIAVDALLHGSTEAVLGENLVTRELQEMGPYAGTVYELFKLWLAIVVLGQALVAARENEPLALLLIPLALTNLIMSSPEQASEQGFVVIGLAFCIAAAKLRSPVERPVYEIGNFRDQVLARRRMRSAGAADQSFPRRRSPRPETNGSPEHI